MELASVFRFYSVSGPISTMPICYSHFTAYYLYSAVTASMLLKHFFAHGHVMGLVSIPLLVTLAPFQISAAPSRQFNT